VRGLGFEPDFESGVIFSPEVVAEMENRPPAVEEFEGQMVVTGSQAQASELTPADWQALLQLQEAQNSLLAYAHLALELSLPTNASPDDVAAELHARDLTLEEVVDWLVGCNYDLDCYRQTMFEELRAGERRARAKRTASMVTLGALATVGIGIAFWWRGR
jgi:hypothetical protein